jgi:hypothetical protein
MLVGRLSTYCVCYSATGRKWVQGQGSAPCVIELMRLALVYSSTPCIKWGDQRDSHPHKRRHRA